MTWHFRQEEGAGWEPLQVPALEEASEEYAGLLQLQCDLFAMRTDLRAEQKRIRMENDADTIPDVAKLLDDPPDGNAVRMEWLRQIRQGFADFEGAVAAIRERMSPAKAAATPAIPAPRLRSMVIPPFRC